MEQEPVRGPAPAIHMADSHSHTNTYQSLMIDNSLINKAWRYLAGTFILI